MNIVRFQPFQELGSLQRDMSRLFDRISPDSENSNDFVFLPAVELQETPESIYLSLEIPGVDSQALDIQASANAISIGGERKERIKAEEQGMIRTEFHYGRFQRVIPLPARIQNNNVRADYIDGILKLTLPKAEEEKNKVIKVNVG